MATGKLSFEIEAVRLGGGATSMLQRSKEINTLWQYSSIILYIPPIVSILHSGLSNTFHFQHHSAIIISFHINSLFRNNRNFL